MASVYVTTLVASTVLFALKAEGMPINGVNEKCVPYSGTVCLTHMNSEGLVYLNVTEPQEMTERKVAKYVKAIKATANPGCHDVTTRALCLYFFPPCKISLTDTKVLRICRDECKKFSTNSCSKLGFVIPGFNHGEGSYLRKTCLAHPSFYEPSDDPCARLDVPSEAEIKEKACRHVHSDRENVTHEIREFQQFNFKEFKTSAFYFEDVILKPYSSDIAERVRSGEFALPNSGSGNLFCTSQETALSELVGQSIQDGSILIPKNVPWPLRSDWKVVGYCFQFGEGVSQVATAVIPIGTMEVYAPDSTTILSNVKLQLVKTKQQIFVEAIGQFNFCGTEFEYSVKPRLESSTILNATGKGDISRTVIELAYDMTDLPGELSSAVQFMQLFKLKLSRPQWIVQWKDSQKTILFKGMGRIEDVHTGNISTEIIIGAGLKFWSMHFAIGLDMSQLIAILGGSADSKLAFLSHRSLVLEDVWIAMSTADASVPPTFNHTELYKLYSVGLLSRGLIVQASGIIRRNCSGTAFCLAMQSLAGQDASFSLMMNQTSGNLLVNITFEGKTWNPNMTVEDIKSANNAWSSFNRALDDLKETGSLEVQGATSTDPTFSCNYKCRLQTVGLHFNQSSLNSVSFRVAKHKTSQVYIVHDVTLEDFELFMCSLDRDQDRGFLSSFLWYNSCSRNAD